MADRDAVYAWADEVVADHGAVHLVVNNAGVALGATIEHMSLRGLRVADGHQLLGRRARHQGLPAPPRGRWRGPHRQRLERVRPDQRSHASPPTTPPSSRCGASPTRCASSSRSAAARCRAPPCTPAASRRTSPATPACDHSVSSLAGDGDDPVTGFDQMARTTPEQAARAILGRGAEEPPPGPHRARRLDHRPPVPPAGGRLPAGSRRRRPAPSTPALTAGRVASGGGPAHREHRSSGVRPATQGGSRGADWRDSRARRSTGRSAPRPRCSTRASREAIAEVGGVGAVSLAVRCGPPRTGLRGSASVGAGLLGAVVRCRDWSRSRSCFVRARGSLRSAPVARRNPR